MGQFPIAVSAASSFTPAPMRRNVTIDDVGRAALFLLSDLGAGTTGEVIHLDAGYNIRGAPAREAT